LEILTERGHNGKGGVKRNKIKGLQPQAKKTSAKSSADPKVQTLFRKKRRKGVGKKGCEVPDSDSNAPETVAHDMENKKKVLRS